MYAENIVLDDDFDFKKMTRQLESLIRRTNELTRVASKLVERVTDIETRYLG